LRPRSPSWCRRRHGHHPGSIALAARTAAAKGATLQRPGWAGNHIGFYPFPNIADENAHWFGENILISMIVLTRNAAAFRADTLRRDRTLVFLSRRELRRRYGFARE
jgi:hypothetical protein